MLSWYHLSINWYVVTTSQIGLYLMATHVNYPRHKSKENILKACYSLGNLECYNSLNSSNQVQRPIVECRLIVISLIVSNVSCLLKYYLSHRTIFCHDVVLDVYLMNFSISRKNNVLFLRYLDICVFVKPTNFKICDTIISIAM